MQIALKDLEIRGAGNLLGGEQSGHIAGVGFDLYLRMIGEAVSTFRGDVAEGQTELRLELPVDAHIPEDYVDSERLRLEAYQKLSTASSPGREGRPDRPGARGAHRPLRRAARRPCCTLIAVSRLRRHGAEGRASARSSRWGRTCASRPATLADSIQVRLQRMYPGSRYFTQTRSARRSRCPTSTAQPLDDAELIAWVTQLLTAIFPAPVAETAAG